MLRYLLLLIVTFTPGQVKAQGIAINNHAKPADASAMLDVASSGKGLLIPRLSTNERNAITFPATALLIFNNDAKQFQVNIGTPAQPRWQSIVSLSAEQPSKDIWQTTGNKLNPDTAFLGTADDKPLQFKTNNVLRLFFDSVDTKIGIGTAFPRSSLDIATTDAIIVPVGTTAQRPPIPIVGMIRYNSTTNKLEGYTSTGWVPLH